MSARLDVALTERCLAESRTRAQELIKKALVTVNGKTVTKPSFAVEEKDTVLVSSSDRICPYVSRGGWKLEAALNAFLVDPIGQTCLDIGASTGGFTDCLLKRGASKVYAVDSGRDQLHPSLRDDRRVISLENRNARYLSREDVPEAVSLAVMDVSFISQTKLYPALITLMKPEARLISLIKPQFEVGPSAVGKGGIVRDEKKREMAVKTVCETAAYYGLVNEGIITSPILGGDGNTEYLALFRLKGESTNEH